MEDNSGAVGVPTHGGQYVNYSVAGTDFEVPNRYKPPIRPIGRGAYGIVWLDFLPLKLKAFVSPAYIRVTILQDAPISIFTFICRLFLILLLKLYSVVLNPSTRQCVCNQHSIEP